MIGKEMNPDGQGKNIWWLFRRGAGPAEYELSGDGESLKVGGLILAVH